MHSIQVITVYSVGSMSNNDTVNYNSTLCQLFPYIMQVLYKLLLYNSYVTGVYDPLYSAVHPMKYLEVSNVKDGCTLALVMQVLYKL